MGIQVLHKLLGVIKDRARWVPRQLSADQKSTRVTNAKEHLRCLNHLSDKVFSKYYYLRWDVGSLFWTWDKGSVKQWKRAGSRLPLKSKLCPLVRKIMLVAIWDTWGILLSHLMPNGQTVTAVLFWSYSEKSQGKTAKESQVSTRKCHPFVWIMWIC